MKRFITILSLCTSPAAFGGYLVCHQQHSGAEGVMVAHQYADGTDLGIFMFLDNARIGVSYTNLAFFESVSRQTWSTLRSVKAADRNRSYILELSKIGVEKTGTLLIKDHQEQHTFETMELSCRAEDFAE